MPTVISYRKERPELCLINRVVMNWPLILIVVVAVIALLIYLVWQNNKDEKTFEEDANFFPEKEEAPESDEHDDGR